VGLKQPPEDLNKEYTDAILAGDKSYAAKDYAGAKIKYQEAQQFRPNEPYPPMHIKMCDDALALVEKQYNDEIEAADKLFAAKNYANAKMKYQSALTFKVDEQYPKDQIVLCDKNGADEKAGDKMNMLYGDSISVADKLFAAKEYSKARAKYYAASQIKPAEQYPKDQIKKCDVALEQLMEQATNDDNGYRDTIALADKLFMANDYANAKLKYIAAAKIKSTEQYPLDQIQKCDDKIQAIDMDAENQYKDLIDMADNLFSAKDWDEAKADYAKASTLKPNEQYPKDRIKACDIQIGKSHSDSIPK